MLQRRKNRRDAIMPREAWVGPPGGRKAGEYDPPSSTGFRNKTPDSGLSLSGTFPSVIITQGRPTVSLHLRSGMLNVQSLSVSVTGACNITISCTGCLFTNLFTFHAFLHGSYKCALPAFEALSCFLVHQIHIMPPRCLSPAAIGTALGWRFSSCCFFCFFGVF